MTEMVISIAERFSAFPAGRYPNDGPFSGQRFREEVLTPALLAALKTGDRVVVLLDGVIGYSSSFLEEVFGGLVRSKITSRDELSRKLEIRANDVAYFTARTDALRYIDEEFARR